MKKKLFSFIIAFAFILTAGICLTACGGNNGDGNNDDNKQFSGFSLEYKDDTYNFDAYDGVRIPYRDGLNFTAEDFVIVVHYYNHADERITATDEYLTFYDVYGQEVTSFDVGFYRIQVIYNNSSLNVYFEISGYDIAEAVVTGYDSQYQYEYNGDYYNGKYIEPDVTVTYNGTELTKNTDYTVVYDRNNIVSTKENPAQIIIQGIGNFAGMKTVTFEIVKIELSEIELNYSSKTIDYDSSSHFDLATSGNIPTLPAGFYESYTTGYKIKKDGVLVYDNVDGHGSIGNNYIQNAGTYEIEYFLSYDEEHFVYNHENPTATLIIRPVDVSTLTTSSTLGETYNGTAFTEDYFHSEKIYLKWGFDALTKGTHYTVTMLDGKYIKDGQVVEDPEGAQLVDNTNASVNGKIGAFRIDGKDNFTGSKIVTYEISPVDIGTIGIPFIDASYTYDELQHKPVLEVMFKETSLIEGTDYTVEYSDEESINAGDKTITFTGLGNFNGVTTRNYKINKAQISLNMLDYDLKTTLLTYNGQNQADEFLQIKVSDGGKDLPDQVVAKFTKGNYYKEDGWQEVGELINAGETQIFVTFVIDEDYQTNYEFTPGNNYRFQKNVWIDKIAVAATLDLDASKFDGGTHASSGSDEDDLYCYDYGTDKTPKVTFSRDLPDTLVEGDDYNLTYSYRQANSNSEFTSVDGLNEIGIYEVRIEMLNPNYSVGTNDYFRIAIRKKMLKAADVEWPPVERLIWTSRAYFDAINKTISTTGTFKKTIDGEPVTVTFKFKSLAPNGSSTDTFVDANNRIAITFTAEKYQAEDHVVDVTIVSPFESFVLNGKSLTVAEQDALKTDNPSLALNAELKITVAEGYMLRYYRTTSSTETFEINSGEPLDVVFGARGERTMTLTIYKVNENAAPSELVYIVFAIEE